MLFYDWFDVTHHPLQILKVWQGGMSFHGGLLGVMLVVFILSRRWQRPLGTILDFVAPLVPLGLACGRIGNFINGELWGRVTNLPWAMVFPGAGPLPRHPSQLYEFFLEGVLLFLITWFYSMRPRPRWAVSGLFILMYGCFRFLVEFVRHPDPQLGFVAFGWMTRGQELSIPMILLGLFLVIQSYRKCDKESSC